MLHWTSIQQVSASIKALDERLEAVELRESRKEEKPPFGGKTLAPVEYDMLTLDERGLPRMVVG